jgi:hypothetical protein
MKSKSRKSTLLAVAAVTAWAAMTFPGSAGEPAAVDEPAPRPVPLKSVFRDDPKGKDPFFPNSSRRQATEPKPRKELIVGPQSLILRGIIGPADQRIALINGRTFATGEELRVRVENGEMTVKCVEIRSASVVVQLNGGTDLHEIQLPEQILPLTSEGRGAE